MLMQRLRGLLAGLGFLLTGLLLSSFLPDLLPGIRMFRAEIFRTNCLLQCAPLFMQSARRK